MTVFEKIEAQQKGREDTIVWMVGEQLKDICRADPHCADIVAADLENPDMSIDKAERQLEAWARKQKRTTGGVGIHPVVSNRILSEFYGLPAAGNPIQAATPASAADTGGFLDLNSFL